MNLFVNVIFFGQDNFCPPLFKGIEVWRTRLVGASSLFISLNNAHNTVSLPLSD